MSRLRRFATAIATPICARPITAAAIFVSVAAIATLAYFLTALFRIEERTVLIGIFTPESRASVTSGRLNITKGTSVDEVVLILGLAAKDQSKAATFVLAVPESLTLGDRSGPYQNLDLTAVETRDHTTRYFFRLKPGASASLMMYFIGEVLATSARELDLKLLVDSTSREALPISLAVAGLDRSDIAVLEPPPEEQNRSAYAFTWPKLPTPSDSGYTLRLQLRDRAGGYRTDFILLLAGMLIGVFASLLTTILWDAAKTVETRLRATKR